MANVVLYDLWPSNNNMKARIALRYKGIEYDTVDIGMGDDAARATVLEVSGQPLTPVLTHGETVVFDSSAIVRYLEANFPGTPRLFPRDREGFQAAEKLEMWARTDLVEPLGTVFGELMKQMGGGEADLEACCAASGRLHELTAEIEERLAEHPFLMGDEMTIADITAAPQVFWGMVPDEVIEKVPPAAFFRDNLQLGEGRERTRDWCMRVMRYAL
jgi:glutathione S-transferase